MKRRSGARAIGLVVTAVEVVLAMVAAACVDVTGLAGPPPGIDAAPIPDAAMADTQTNAPDSPPLDAANTVADASDASVRPWGAWCASRSPTPIVCLDFDGPVPIEQTWLPWRFDGNGSYLVDRADGGFVSPPAALRFDAPSANPSSTAKLTTTIGGNALTHLRVTVAIRTTALPVRGDLIALQLDASPFLVKLYVGGERSGETWLTAGSTSPPPRFFFPSQLPLGVWHAFEIEIDVPTRSVRTTVDGRATTATLPQATEAGVLRTIDVGAMVVPGSGLGEVDQASIRIDNVALYL